MTKLKDCLIGFITGDAMGVPIEFYPREKLIKNPVKKMYGFGSHYVPAGSWSDDTSMTIATIDSIVQNKGWNYKDIFEKWYKWAVDYEYTPCNLRFDIGNTCLEAIMNYSKKGKDPLECGLNDIKSNGNGSLMRMIPVVFYSYYKKLKVKDIIKLTNEVSSLTHAHDISKLGCYIYVRYMMYLLEGFDKYEAYNKIRKLSYSFYSKKSIDVYNRILKNDISKLEIDDISSSGYVVSTLEASLWVILNTKNFNQAIIGSINLGNDTDTIGAITGSIAGLIYGYDNIDKKWENKLLRLDYLLNLITEFDNYLLMK